MYYDFLIVIGLVISVAAQIGVTSSYKKYKKILNEKDYTGYDVARKILDNNNLKDILILETKGDLTDHYDPTKKLIKLSTDIYHGSSIASLAVAAHECGHAIQDKINYKPMKIRSLIFPVVNLCTYSGYFIIAIGTIFSYNLVELGIILLSSVLIFQLITLPVEINASNRALKEISRLKIAEESEKDSAKKMLIAAAFTYVSSLIASFLQILRLFLIFDNNKDN